MCQLFLKKHSAMDLISKVWDIKGMTLSAFELMLLTAKKKSWKFRIILNVWLESRKLNIFAKFRASDFS